MTMLLNAIAGLAIFAVFRRCAAIVFRRASPDIAAATARTASVPPWPSTMWLADTATGKVLKADLRKRYT